MLSTGKGHKNRKFSRYGLTDYFISNGKSIPAYMVHRDTGAVVRRYVKTNKEWRKANGR